MDNYKYKIQTLREFEMRIIPDIIHSNEAWGFELVQIIPITSFGCSDGCRIIFKLKDLKV